MATIKKLEEIKLPFVTINVLDLKGHADTMDTIPDFVTKIRYQVTNTTKEPDGKNSEYEYGLSFTDVKPFPKHAEYVIQDYVAKAIEYHLYELTHRYLGTKIENRTPQYELSHSSMSRIMEIVRQDHSPSPLKLEYLKNGKPAIEFGIGRDIYVQIAPPDMKLTVKSMSEGHPFAFMNPLVFGEDEPLIEGEIEIFGGINRIYLWRKYNNKVFNHHALKRMLSQETFNVLKQNEKLIDALGGFVAFDLHENNNDRILKLQS